MGKLSSYLTCGVSLRTGQAIFHHFIFHVFTQFLFLNFFLKFISQILVSRVV